MTPFEDWVTTDPHTHKIDDMSTETQKTALQCGPAALNAAHARFTDGAIDPVTYAAIVSAHSPTIGSNPQSMADVTMGAGERPVGGVKHSREDLFTNFVNAMDLGPTNPMHLEPTQKERKKGNKKKADVCNANGAGTWYSDTSGLQVPDDKMERVPEDDAMLGPNKSCLSLPCVLCPFLWVVQFRSGTIPSKLLPCDYKDAIVATICPTCETVPVFTHTITEIDSSQFNTIFMNPLLMDSVKQFVGKDVPVIAWGNQFLFINACEILDMAKREGTITTVILDSKASNL